MKERAEIVLKDNAIFVNAELHNCKVVLEGNHIRLWNSRLIDSEWIDKGEDNEVLDVRED